MRNDFEKSFLVTLYERKNELRHFGVKIGNCWYYNLYEILFFVEIKIIKSHPILSIKKTQKIINSYLFKENFKKFKFLKQNNINILCNQIFLHTKDFNHEKEVPLGPVFSKNLDDPVCLINHFSIISLLDDHYCLSIKECDLNREITQKHKKNK